MSYRGQQEEKELQQENWSSFDSSLLPPQLSLLFSPLLEKLPTWPDFTAKLKSRWFKRFNYDIQKECDCII